MCITDSYSIFSYKIKDIYFSVHDARPELPFIRFPHNPNIQKPNNLSLSLRFNLITNTLKQI
jgi:hypothetical protein